MAAYMAPPAVPIPPPSSHHHHHPNFAADPPTAICTRGEVIVMQDPDGYPYTIENTPYNRLRHLDYKGRRIMYAFDDENIVEETYTPGIFNCRSAGRRLIQISDTAAVTTSIIERDRDSYVNLCVKWISATLQRDYIETYVRGHRRLSYNRTDDMYEVDGGMFRVTPGGNAEYAMHDNDGTIKSWHSLCIVNTEARDDVYVVDPQMGRICVTPKTQMVVGKLMFLMYPTRDNVFLNQLPPRVRRHVERLIAKGAPSSTYDAAPRYDDIRGVEEGAGGNAGDGGGARQ